MAARARACLRRASTCSLRQGLVSRASAALRAAAGGTMAMTLVTLWITGRTTALCWRCMPPTMRLIMPSLALTISLAREDALIAEEEAAHQEVKKEECVAPDSSGCV